eukprot:4789225-Prymnesium_polylepis.2
MLGKRRTAGAPAWFVSRRLLTLVARQRARVRMAYPVLPPQRRHCGGAHHQQLQQGGLIADAVEPREPRLQCHGHTLVGCRVDFVRPLPLARLPVPLPFARLRRLLTLGDLPTCMHPLLLSQIHPIEHFCGDERCETALGRTEAATVVSYHLNKLLRHPE